MKNIPEKTQSIDGVESSNVAVLDMCKCQRAPKRKRQRNCHFCNREANRKYQKRLKRESEAFQQIAASIRRL